MPAGALAYFEDAAAVRADGSGDAATLAARAEFGLGASLLALGRREEALPLLRVATPGLRRLLGEDHEESRAASRVLAALP